VPESKTDWIFFLIGAVMIAALVLVIVFGRAQATTRTSPRADTSNPSTVTTVVTVPTMSATNAPTTTATTTNVATTTAVASIELSLRALRDTWFSVRRDARSGPTLYEGTLHAGATKSFTGMTFWVRFGAASNLSVTLDGKNLALPGGTYSVPITSAGLGSPRA
jgi:uncharacterized protein DUF4115